jgi:circadian clock protein KaiB
MMEGCVFILYIIGGSRSGMQAISSLEHVLEDWPDDHFSLEIIDVLEHPELAEEEKIIATPTLI